MVRHRVEFLVVQRLAGGTMPFIRRYTTSCGVLVEDTKILPFDVAVAELLRSAGLPPETEVHAQLFLSDDGVLKELTATDRFLFLKQFLELGLKHIVGLHYLSMLKPFVKRRFRRNAVAHGLDAYTTQVLYFNQTLQAACLGRIGFDKYRYLFDRTDKYRRDIRAIINALKVDPNDRLRLRSIAGDPQPINSAQHRFVQFADVAGYFLGSHHQIEVRTFQPRPGLLRHRESIIQVYELLRPKIVNFVETAIFIDWQALQHWTHPKRRARRKDWTMKLKSDQVELIAQYLDAMAELFELTDEQLERLEQGEKLSADNVKGWRDKTNVLRERSEQLAELFWTA